MLKILLVIAQLCPGLYRCQKKLINCVAPKGLDSKPITSNSLTKAQIDSYERKLWECVEVKR